MVTSITDAADTPNSRTYGYDALSRLTTASGPWGSGSYTYDPLGNLRAKTLGSRNVTISYDATKNRVSQSVDTGTSGTRSFANDARGNATTVGSLAFVYDMADQPRAVSSGVNGNYRYDGNLKRVRAQVDGKTIYNVYDLSGQLVHVDKVTDGEATDYVSGPDGVFARITNNAITYMHNDHLGSSSSGRNAWGVPQWTERYTPYGEALLSPTANDDLAGFTGHIRDKATGLNYMQARYQDPVIGRFLSIDPVTFMGSGNKPGMFNRYGYTLNNPTNNIDPDGRCAWSLSAGAGDGIGNFCRGLVEGATGSYTSWKLSRGVTQGDPKSLFIAHGMSIGAQIARQNPSEAAKLAVNSLGENKARMAGRILGGSFTSAIGGKGVGAGYRKLGGGKFIQSTAGLSIGATNFSAGQIASAAASLGGLYDSISDAGFDPGDVSVGAVGNAAIISAAGGDIEFNSETGAITATLPAQAGSRLRRTVELEELKNE